MLSQNKTWSFHSGGYEIDFFLDVKQYSLVETGSSSSDESVVLIFLSEHEGKENTRSAFKT